MSSCCRWLARLNRMISSPLGNTCSRSKMVLTDIGEDVLRVATVLQGHCQLARCWIHLGIGCQRFDVSVVCTAVARLEEACCRPFGLTGRAVTTEISTRCDELKGVMREYQGHQGRCREMWTNRDKTGRGKGDDVLLYCLYFRIVMVVKAPSQGRGLPQSVAASCAATEQSVLQLGLGRTCKMQKAKARKQIK